MAGSLVKAVPNILSTLRLLLALGFWAVPGPWRFAAIVAGAASDGLDGFIARRYCATSIAGGLLDGIADKLLTLSVMLTFAIEGTIGAWQVLILILRDLVVAALAGYAIAIRRLDAFRHMPARQAGKVASALLYVWIALVALDVPAAAGWSVFALAATASLAAAGDYIRQFLTRPASLRGVRHAEPRPSPPTDARNP